MTKKKYAEVDRILDVIVIQEELKQSMIEGQLLKQKITELTDKFK